MHLVRVVFRNRARHANSNSVKKRVPFVKVLLVELGDMYRNSVQHVGFCKVLCIRDEKMCVYPSVRLS